MRQRKDPAMVAELREWFREQRARSGLSQERFARKLNVPLKACTRWEHGVSLPSYEYLIRIN
jgi:DNA-binding transcriptional regulator YiaG